MTAGLNLVGNIIRFSYPQDDDQGGSVPSGTILYTPVFARISAMKPTQALLEQGLETPEIYSATLSPGNISIRHNDQYEVTSPPISSYYQKKFVVIGIQHTSFDDSRKYLQVSLRRLEIANSNNLQ